MATKTKAAPEKAVERAMRRCVFCLKTVREVAGMIESETTGARICNECVGLCVGIMEKDGVPMPR